MSLIDVTLPEMILITLSSIALWCGLLCITYAIQWVYSWVNDEKLTDDNYLIIQIMRLMGYTYRPNNHFSFIHPTKNDSDGFEGFCLSTFIAFIIPLIILITLKFPFWVGLVALVVSGLFLFRFVIRISKRLNVHLIDHK